MVSGNQYYRVQEDITLKMENIIYDMDMCIESLETDYFKSPNEGLCSVFGEMLAEDESKNNMIFKLVDLSNDTYYSAIKSKKLSKLELLRLKDKQKYTSYLMEAIVNRLDQLNAISSENSAKRNREEKSVDSDQ